MTLIRSIFAEAVGLFVDDGMLALLCAGLILSVTLATLLLGLPALWSATVLLIGCIVILAWSVFRATR